MFCDKRIKLNGNCNCPFADGVLCNIGDVIPHEYKIPCRWTEDDYNLAKILSRNGADTIKKSGGATTWIKGSLLNPLDSGMLPMGVFEALNNNDSIRLHDIITEYEEDNQI